MLKIWLRCCRSLWWNGSDFNQSL